MTVPVQTVIGLCRPAVVVILGMFAALGEAQSGAGLPAWLLARALLVVAGYVVFSAGLNDIADASIDRVNLPADRHRPLVTGDATVSDLAAIAAVAGLAALAASASIGWFALLVTAAGLVVSAGYSLRPFRICDRGAIGALLLPAAYVVVPYLVGAAGVASPPSWHTLVLLPGLYVGFLGRIVLKDFRDVRGDRLFGKRTFVVRHGRRATCVFSGACWLLGGVWLSLMQLAALPALVIAAYAGLPLALLWNLAENRGPRRDERLVSAIAILGRGMVLALITSDSASTAGWVPLGRDALLAALLTVSLGQARSMVKFGPTGLRLVPPDRSAGLRLPIARGPIDPMSADAGNADGDPLLGCVDASRSLTLR